jgi:hypothetical protein
MEEREVEGEAKTQRKRPLIESDEKFRGLTELKK